MILDTLLAYTQPLPSQAETDEGKRSDYVYRNLFFNKIID